jgi:hypothetical protein
VVAPLDALRWVRPAVAEEERDDVDVAVAASGEQSGSGVDAPVRGEALDDPEVPILRRSVDRPTPLALYISETVTEEEADDVIVAPQSSDDEGRVPKVIITEVHGFIDNLIAVMGLECIRMRGVDDRVRGEALDDYRVAHSTRVGEREVQDIRVAVHVRLVTPLNQNREEVAPEPREKAVDDRDMPLLCRVYQLLHLVWQERAIAVVEEALDDALGAALDRKGEERVARRPRRLGSPGHAGTIQRHRIDVVALDCAEEVKEVAEQGRALGGRAPLRPLRPHAAVAHPIPRESGYLGEVEEGAEHHGRPRG